MVTNNISIGHPELPSTLREKELDFAAMVYILKSIIRRTSPVTEMVSHDIAIQFLSCGQSPDPEYPQIVTYKILDEPPGYNDYMINDLLARAERIIRLLTNDMWKDLAALEEQTQTK